MANMKKQPLSVTHSQLAKEWDDKKNNPLTPGDVTAGSGKKVWWKCSKCSFEWQAVIGSRSRGHACPECAKSIRNLNVMRSKTIQGVNDLATKAPELMKEWDYAKNDRFSPKEIACSSNYLVWWICSRCGHNWQASVINRYHGNRCPQCMRHYHTSYSEQAVFHYVKVWFSDAINGYKPDWLDPKMEIDIFIPTELIAIEYDGEAFHKRKSESDNYKAEKIQEQGIKLIRIREPKLEPIEDGSYTIWTSRPKQSLLYLNDTIVELAEYLKTISNRNFDVDVSIERDYDAIIQEVHGMISMKSVGHLETTTFQGF